MEVKRPKLTNKDIEWYTQRAKDWGEDRCASALAFLQDSEKRKRQQEAQECKACYYFKSIRIGGAAMTNWWCGICESEQMSGSTHCPRICKECSKKYQLCCECGGDIHTRVRREAPLPV